MAKGFIYILTAPSGWDQPKIKYRRHRLAEYLIRQGDTEGVFWIYPVSASIRKKGSYKTAKTEIDRSFNFIKNKQGIIEIALPDFMPGRYMQFKNSCGSPYFNKLKEKLNSYDAQKVLLFTYPVYPYIIDLINWDSVAYDCSDFWTKPSAGFRASDFSSIFFDSFIGTAERYIINKSNVITTTAEYLASSIKNNTGRDSILIENGVDLSKFKSEVLLEEKVYEKIPRPRLGYVGGMKGKVDFELLDELARQNPLWSIVLVGPGFFEGIDIFNKLVDKSNVYYIGEVANELVPDYISHLQLGLLPYREIEYNKGSFPLKFYEYFACGIPVVGCGVPSTDRYVRNKMYLHVDRAEFQDACKEALSWDVRNSEANKKYRIEFARSAIWENKLSEIKQVVKNSINK